MNSAFTAFTLGTLGTLAHFRHFRPRGLTLLELLVALGVFVVLLSLLFGLILKVTDLTQRGRGQAALQEGVTLALEQLSRELRGAVALRWEGSTLWATTLSGDAVVYHWNERGVLVREEASGSHRLLPEPLDATGFYWYAEGDLLWLTLTARARPVENQPSLIYTATTAVTLRNEG